MEIYRNTQCPELSDSLPTQAFIKRVDDLINAMMSRTPLNALRPDEHCPQRAVIIDHFYIKNAKNCSNYHTNSFNSLRQGDALHR